VGTAYGSEFSFTTLALPQIITSAIGSVTGTTAQSGGMVNSDGGSPVTARGVCWSTSSSPTIALSTKTTNGSGVGSFNSSIIGLQLGTTYYLRAYATNSVGTAYGPQITFTTLAAGQFTDIDGNIYDTIAIGTQIWMKQNLKVSKYRNGDSVSTNLDNSAWLNTNSGAYTIYNNSPANDSIFGKLYNWYAIADARGLCPTGWHVPSDSEWAILENYLGGTTVAGGKMKAISSLWLTSNSISTNSSGFSGLPGGYRHPQGHFDVVGVWGYWWSSSQNSTSYAWNRVLSYAATNIYRGDDSKLFGFSIRCIKD
jgi:uncharacterized protein (TIGR02145 family)